VQQPTTPAGPPAPASAPVPRADSSRQYWADRRLPRAAVAVCTLLSCATALLPQYALAAGRELPVGRMAGLAADAGGQVGGGASHRGTRQGGSCSTSGTTVTCTFTAANTTGGEGSFTVPSGVSAITVSATGAPGGPGGPGFGSIPGATGAVVTGAALSVVQGSTLYAEVGTAGSSGRATAGANPGGTGAGSGGSGDAAGGGGGGASGVQTCSATAPTCTYTGGIGDPRLVVAGGGGSSSSAGGGTGAGPGGAGAQGGGGAGGGFGIGGGGGGAFLGAAGNGTTSGGGAGAVGAGNGGGAGAATAGGGGGGGGTNAFGGGGGGATGGGGGEGSGGGSAARGGSGLTGGGGAGGGGGWFGGGAGGLTGGGGAGSSYAPASSGASAGPAALTATPEVVISYTQPVTTMTGRAFGVRSTGRVTVAATPDTGQISTADASSTLRCTDVRHISAGLDGWDVCAGVVTAPARNTTSATSTANADVKWLMIAAKGLPPVRLGWVDAASRTTCTGSSGRSSIGYLIVGRDPIRITSPRPNTTIHRAGFTLILNEQIPVPGGLTVNAVHLEAPGLDTVIASATSDIHSCHT